MKDKADFEQFVLTLLNYYKLAIDPLIPRNSSEPDRQSVSEIYLGIY